MAQAVRQAAGVSERGQRAEAADGISAGEVRRDGGPARGAVRGARLAGASLQRGPVGDAAAYLCGAEAGGRGAFGVVRGARHGGLYAVESGGAGRAAWRGGWAGCAAGAERQPSASA